MENEFINYYSKYIILNKKYKKLIKELNILKEGNDDKIYTFYLEENSELIELNDTLRESILDLKIHINKLETDISNLEKCIENDKRD